MWLGSAHVLGASSAASQAYWQKPGLKVEAGFRPRHSDTRCGHPQRAAQLAFLLKL